VLRNPRMVVFLSTDDKHCSRKAACAATTGLRDRNSRDKEPYAEDITTQEGCWPKPTPPNNSRRQETPAESPGCRNLSHVAG